MNQQKFQKIPLHYFFGFISLSVSVSLSLTHTHRGQLLASFIHRLPTTGTQAPNALRFHKLSKARTNVETNEQ